MAANVSEQPVGVVTHWFGRLKVATVRLQAPLKVGDRVHVKGANDDFRARVKSMELNHKAVEAADAGMEVGVKMGGRAHVGDKVLRVEGDAGPWAWLRKLLGS